MNKIMFNDYEMRELVKKTGLSKLELLGVIGAMNDIFVPKAKGQRQYDVDEAMGRTI